MSSFLFLQQHSACLVRLIWTVLEMESRWPHSFQDWFKISGSILLHFLSSFFFRRLVSVYVVYPCSRIDTTAAKKNCVFISSDKSDFHMVDNLSIAVTCLR